jgi:hypothetical protein
MKKIILYLERTAIALALMFRMRGGMRVETINKGETVQGSQEVHP